MSKFRLRIMVLSMALVLALSVTAFGWNLVGTIAEDAFVSASLRGLALSNDDSVLYIANLQDMSIMAYDVASTKSLGEASLAVHNPGAYGKAAFVDAAGHVWAPGTVPEVYRFDADLNHVATYKLQTFGVIGPEGAVVGNDGSLYVTDRRVGIFKFNVDGSTITPDAAFGTNGRVTIGADLRQPGLAADGSILLGDYGGNVIYRIDPKTGAVSTFAEIAAPYHIDVDTNGNVYVVHYSGAPMLTVLDAQGTVLVTKTKAELGINTEAAGIAVSSDGSKVFVLDQQRPTGGVVRVFDTK